MNLPLPTPTPSEFAALTNYLRYLHSRGVTSFNVAFDQNRPEEARDVQLRLTDGQLIDCTTQAELLQIEEAKSCSR